MIFIKTAEEIAIMKESAEILSQTFGFIKQFIKPGVKTKDIDIAAEEFILSKGAKPNFKGYSGYPATLCISVNHQVVHGIPSNYTLKEGDIISVDGGVKYKGYHSDMAYTFIVGNVHPNVQKLVNVTKECLYLGINEAKVGKRIGDIGSAIQTYAERNGFSVVRELVGHGIGKSLHEEPQIPNYGKAGKGVALKEGMTIAIEPMINMGKKDVFQESDGWTIVTKDLLPSAHFEHTVAILKDKTEILTTYKYIENN
ncbi:MAG: type I methionyl aminopeptidase [Bacteroidales bacterium]|nr:type I methionyl aminopeptidase [Bacteroidales bacterium]